MIFTFVFCDHSKSKVNVSIGPPKHQVYLFFWKWVCIVFHNKILLITRNVSLKFSRAEWTCLDDSCSSEIGMVTVAIRLVVVCCREVLLKSRWWSQMNMSSDLDELLSCCFHFSLRNHEMGGFFGSSTDSHNHGIVISVAVRGVLGLQIGNLVLRELNCFFRSDSHMKVVVWGYGKQARKCEGWFTIGQFSVRIKIWFECEKCWFYCHLKGSIDNPQDNVFIHVCLDLFMYLKSNQFWVHAWLLHLICYF